jgi:hypothetical protein
MRILAELLARNLSPELTLRFLPGTGEAHWGYGYRQPKGTTKASEWPSLQG